MKHSHTAREQASKHDRPVHAKATVQSSPPLHPMLQLQRQIGNQAVGRLIQTKLAVGEPDDVYEQEADRVAAEVVREIHASAPPAAQPQLPANITSTPHIQSLLQGKTTMGKMAVSTEVEASIQQKRGSGQPLPDGLRSSMEQAFGTNFSGVRVHTDGESDRLNQLVQARAFTTGQDVFFRQGSYQPESRGGQELIAHELTHVVQQNKDTIRRSPTHPFDNKTRTSEIAAFYMQGPVIQCKGRTEFPWRGVVVGSNVELHEGTVSRLLKEGTLVTVVEKANGHYIVKVNIDNSEMQGEVPISNIEEPLTKTIQEQIIKNNNNNENGIQWGGSENEKHISKLESFPKPEKVFSLLCFEFVGYAAVLAKVITEFEFKRILTSDSKNYGSQTDKWATILKGTKEEKVIKINLKEDVEGWEAYKKSNSFQAGDFVVLRSDISSDSSTHIAVATGNSDEVYSLWHYSKGKPEKTSITEWIKSGEFDYGKCPHVVVITPTWHDFSEPLVQNSPL
jgi:Domain of unknown function (DUF4157)